MGVSVGNGVRGRISLQAKNPRIFCPRISRIFVQASAEPNLFGLCRVQPKMSKKFTRIQCASKMATCSVARIFTNSMRADDWGMSCGVVPARHIVLASPFRALRTRLLSLRSVVPSRHLTQVTKALKMFEFVRFVRPNRSPLLRRAMNSCRFVRFVGKK